MTDRKMTCDVLVVGSGGAGLRAACAAAEAGACVLLAAKGRVDRSGATLLAGANVSADVMCDGGSLWRMGIKSADPRDTQEQWFRDIVHEGFYLNRRELVRQYVEQAPAEVAGLLRSGAALTAADEGGRQIGIPGSAILDVLWRRARDASVRVLQDVTLCDLLADGNAMAAGALLLDIPTGELIEVSAGAVVLATGGMHGCYAFNSGTTGLCGEGQAAAIRLGADMTLMEMVTFCPDVICAPRRFRGNILPYILQCIGYGSLKNRLDEDFLPRYYSPSAIRLALGSEWNKLLLSYAMWREAQAGRCDENGGVRYSLASLTPGERAALEETLPRLSRGIYRDIMALHDRQGWLSVSAAGHYFDGGIAVNADMAASVPGLFAAGECTGGLFGANRVAAATTQMLVQGAAAGKSAARYARAAGTRSVDPGVLERACAEALAPLYAPGGESPRRVRAATVEIVSRCAGIVRNAQDMTEGIRQLDETDGLMAAPQRRERACNREWLDALETRSLRICGRAILQSSLARCESRGVFIRSDCPMTDNDRFLCETRLHSGGVVLQPVEQSRTSAEPGRTDYFEELERVFARLSYAEGGAVHE